MRLKDFIKPKPTEKCTTLSQATCSCSKEADNLKIQIAQLKKQMQETSPATFFTPYIFEEVDHFGGGTPSFFSVRKQNA